MWNLMCLSMIMRKEANFERKNFDNTYKVDSLNYDIDADAFAIDGDLTDYKESTDIENDVIIDLDSKGLVVGVEVLDVSRIFDVEKTFLKNIEFFCADISVNTETLKVKMTLSTKSGSSIASRIVTCEGINDISIPASETLLIFNSSKSEID
jgi:uncharacterized protein YuzE